MFSFLTWSLSVWPHAHLHIIISVTPSFVHVGASDWHCFHPVQQSCLNDYLVYLSLHVWWYSLVAYEHFLMAFNLDTCTLSLPLTLSFLSSPRLPSTAPVPTPVRLSPLRTAPHHLRPSSAKVLFSDVFRQSIHHNGKQERAESGSLLESNFHGKGFACSCSTTHYSFALMAHVLHQSDVLIWHPLVSHAPIQLLVHAYYEHLINITKCPSEMFDIRIDIQFESHINY